jgi:hypothetical protein
MIDKEFLMLVTYFQNEFGVWEVFLPNNADGSSPIPHGSRVKVFFTAWSVFFFWFSASPKLIDDVVTIYR